MTTPENSSAAADPLAAFEAPSAEKEGIWIDVEHPETGDVLMRWKISRFGGRNNAAIIKEERKLKGKLPPAVRRKIDAGKGDPEIVDRLNRQVFVRVSCLDWKIENNAIEAPETFNHGAADVLLERYPRMYDLISDLAIEEDTFAADRLEEDLGNSQSTSDGSLKTPAASPASSNEKS